LRIESTPVIMRVVTSSAVRLMPPPMSTRTNAKLRAAYGVAPISAD
jgi:hypothetical protein